MALPRPSHPPYGGLLLGSVCGLLLMVFKVKCGYPKQSSSPTSMFWWPMGLDLVLVPASRGRIGCSGMEGDDVTTLA